MSDASAPCAGQKSQVQIQVPGRGTAQPAEPRRGKAVQSEYDNSSINHFPTPTGNGDGRELFGSRWLVAIVIKDLPGSIFLS